MNFARFLQAIPNALSLLRVGLGLAFPWLGLTWRLPAVLAAALTDLLDGETSRLFKAQSLLGQILDPIADKLFLMLVVITLLWDETLTWWEMLLVALRDIVLLLGAAGMLLRRGWAAGKAMRPRLLGKCTTALQFAFLVALLCETPRLTLGLLIAVAVLGALAALDYFVASRSAL
jgi:phosphatidylglycerophosphate synthase